MAFFKTTLTMHNHIISVCFLQALLIALLAIILNSLTNFYDSDYYSGIIYIHGPIIQVRRDMYHLIL